MTLPKVAATAASFTPPMAAAYAAPPSPVARPSAIYAEEDAEAISREGASLNETGTEAEEIVDHMASGLAGKISDFADYLESLNGQNKVALVELIAKYAAAIILGMNAPLLVGGGIVVGIVVRVFSREQLNEIQEAVSRIGTALTSGVKGLSVVVTTSFAPSALPLIAGLCVGFDLGSRVNARWLGEEMDDMLAKVGKPGSEGKEEDVVGDDDSADPLAVALAPSPSLPKEASPKPPVAPIQEGVKVS